MISGSVGHLPAPNTTHHWPAAYVHVIPVNGCTSRVMPIWSTHFLRRTSLTDCDSNEKSNISDMPTDFRLYHRGYRHNGPLTQPGITDIGSKHHLPEHIPH